MTQLRCVRAHRTILLVWLALAPAVARAGFSVDEAWLGTRLGDMQGCIDQWLINRGLDSEYFRQTVLAPTFQEVADEVERSEDVILLLGFYWRQGNNWNRCGGHYVTVAGVDTPNQAIVLSDPGLNNAEPPPAGNAALGRVRGLTHTDHAPAVSPPPDHDDTSNLSHDRYNSGPSNTLNATWAVPNYGTAGGPTTCNDVARWCMGSDWGQNQADPTQPQDPCFNPLESVSAEVEAMVDVSPEQTAICAYLVTSDVWPDNLRVRKGTCSPAATTPAYDVIRGKLCNLQMTPVPQSDLGHVVCLYNDAQIDEFDDLSPDDTDCFGGWFYLVRQSTDFDYGQAFPGSELRVPSSGGCP